MLQHISLNNYIVIDNLNLDLKQGLTCLTGETGAGKSIWVDAMSIALGARTDKSIIKPGSDQCSICLSFNIDALPAAQHYLQQHQLTITPQNTCILRRTINQQGRSAHYINDTPCTGKLVKNLAPLLIQISGQYQQQALLDKKQHTLLDPLIADPDQINQVRQSYLQWQQIKAQVTDRKKQLYELDNAYALTQYQQQELAEFDPQQDEWQTLQAEQRQRYSYQDRLNILLQIQQQLTDDTTCNCLSQLNQSIQQLEKITGHSPNQNCQLTHERLDTVLNSLKHARIEIEEALIDIEQETKNITEDDGLLPKIEHRLSRIHQLARKHKASPDQLYQHLQELTARIEQQHILNEQMKNLEEKLQTAEQSFLQLAEKLSINRQQAATQLAKHITAYLKQLAMPHSACQFQIDSGPQYACAAGIDQVQLQVKTNPLAPFQPLDKVASGGELSRIMLALAVIKANHCATPTLIFDEIDTGIGGKTAAMVGKLLRELGHHTQVLCITHLAQVAACAVHHIQIEKNIADNKQIMMQAKALSPAQRVEELARMIGGESITDSARKHVTDLLEQP